MPEAASFRETRGLRRGDDVVAVSVVENFLDTNSVAYMSRASDAQLSAADVGDAARKFTVRVDCRR
jgi:hypothetical protein